MELTAPSLRSLGDYRRLFLDPAVTAWLRPAPLRPMGEGDVIGLLERDIQHWRQHGWGPWVVRVDGAFAGRCGLCTTEVEGVREIELAWSVLPAFQGRGIARAATAEVIALAAADGRRRFLHAFPSVDNAPSNAICRKLGFELLGEHDFEYPKGHWMRCNDWRLTLFEDG